MALTRLQVSNLRCIENLDFEIPRFAAIIGPNGVGKSTILGCFRVFNQAAEQCLSNTISEYGGFSQALRWQGHAPRIEFAISLSLESGAYEYSLSLDVEGRGYFVSREQLLYELDPRNRRLGLPQMDAPLVIPHGCPLDNPRTARMVPGFVIANNGLDRLYPRPDGTVDRFTVSKQAEPILGILRGRNPETSMIGDVFRGISSWDAHKLQLSEIRRPQPLQPATLPSQSGDNLLSVLYGLKSERRETYDQLIGMLRVFVPELEDIEFPLAGKGYAGLSWYQHGLSKPLDPQQLSDGTLRLLWLATILYTVPDDGLAMFDEPEISMHPQWLQLLVGLMRHMSPRTQIMVATHSDQLVRWLSPEELILADSEEGTTTLRRGDQMNLGDWLKDYSLDQLWHMGELGARQ